MMTSCLLTSTASKKSKHPSQAIRFSCQPRVPLRASQKKECLLIKEGARFVSIKPKSFKIDPPSKRSAEHYWLRPLFLVCTYTFGISLLIPKPHDKLSQFRSKTPEPGTGQCFGVLFPLTCMRRQHRSSPGRQGGTLGSWSFVSTGRSQTAHDIFDKMIEPTVCVCSLLCFYTLLSLDVGYENYNTGSSC